MSGVPEAQVDGLLFKYGGDPRFAVADYAHSTPSGAVGMRVGSHASPSTLKEPGLLWREGDNTCFSMIRELGGELSDILTLKRSHDLYACPNGFCRVLVLLRGCRFTCVCGDGSFARVGSPPLLLPREANSLTRC